VREKLTGLTQPPAGGPGQLIRAARREAIHAVSRNRHAGLT